MVVSLKIPNHGLFLYTLKFPVVKVRLRPKPPTWNLGCICFKVLLVGPWPWAPHQKTKYNNIQKFTVHSRVYMGDITKPQHFALDQSRNTLSSGKAYQMMKLHGRMNIFFCTTHPYLYFVDEVFQRAMTCNKTK